MPARKLYLITVITLILVTGTVYLALQLPFSGISYFHADLSQEKTPYLVVSSISDRTSIQPPTLASGNRVTALRKIGGDWFTLESTDMLEEPDMLADYQAYFRFLSRQDILHDITSQNSYELKTQDEVIYTVERTGRTLTDLPFIFWFQIVCGVIAVLTGFSVYTFRQSDPASLQYAINGSSFLLVTLAASVYSGRELALDGELFYFLNTSNHLGSLVFSASFLSLFFLYPQRLSRLPWHWVFMAVYCTIFLLGITDTVFDNHDESLRLPIIIALLGSMILAVAQRYRSRNDPVQKAALRWFALSLLVGGSLFVVITIAMTYFDRHTSIPQGYSLGFILIMYLGIALGITRYRLFQLEAWWLSAWIWALGGALLLAADALMSYFLHINHNVSLLLALILVGWLYFPLRQWFAKKLFHRSNVSIEKLFPDVLHLLFSSNHVHTMSQNWQSLLQKVFDPLQVERLPSSGNRQPRLSEQGECLYLPDIDDQTLLALRYPAKGKRLYVKNDVSLAKALWQLLQHALEEKSAYEQGRRKERKRIGRDLHDDVGTRLLTLIHKSSNSEVASLAREAMGELRVVLRSLDETPRLLQDSLGDWRGEIEQRCEAAAISLNWKQNGDDAKRFITPRQYADIQRIIRETVTNALRHSRPAWITVSSEISEQLRLQIVHDGCESNIADWQAGRGLRNIDYRIKALRGNLHRSQQNGQVTTIIEVPLIA